MSNIQFLLLTDLVKYFYFRDIPSPFDKLKVDFNTVKKMLGLRPMNEPWIWPVPDIMLG